MDGSVLEHSDSDSGESWTLLERVPAYADDAPEFAEDPARLENEAVDIMDKDDDTDGISIISDSEPESSTPCELIFDKPEENRPPEHTADFISVTPLPTNNEDNHESVTGEDDLLGDTNGKLKTYVHRRNKRLSTVLNIIVLGSVITAAGVAIGHMWGVKNECSVHNNPSVNKILSNLYKLQEENAYLRNKLKEITLVNNLQMQRKTEIEKPTKPNKCRKIFEESLNNKNVDKFTKCVDIHTADKLESHLITQDFEKDFLHDINKLRNVYQQNKSWLDEEIAKRMQHEKKYVRKMKNNLKSAKSIRVNEDHKMTTVEPVKRQLESITESPAAETVINVTEPIASAGFNVSEDGKDPTDRKISYSDSLKSEHKIKKRSFSETNTDKKIKEYIKKKKPRKEPDVVSETSISDHETKKDNRYNAHKYKPDKKKQDRNKINKKQKRRNKYEQWEMKGGYLKDYDDFSSIASQENDFALKNPDKNFQSRNFEQNNYIYQFAEPEENLKTADVLNDPKVKGEYGGVKHNNVQEKGDKDVPWYDKRAALRTEARKKLEQELFGESTPNNAAWYFRRMQRREQCRIKGDNSTYKRLSKRLMNFKTKH